MEPGGERGAGVGSVGHLHHERARHDALAVQKALEMAMTVRLNGGRVHGEVET
jgi:hypothetical protein